MKEGREVSKYQQKNRDRDEYQAIFDEEKIRSLTIQSNIDDYLVAHKNQGIHDPTIYWNENDGGFYSPLRGTQAMDKMALR